jgi:hypothetical protein
VFTNAVSACFFSFSTLTFFSPMLVFAVTFAVLAASFASFSNLFASFLAGDRSHKQLESLAGKLRIAPALLEFKAGPSAGGGLETACWDDIALTNPSDLRVGEKRYRYSSRIQFRSTESQVARLRSRCEPRSNGRQARERTRRSPMDRQSRKHRCDGVNGLGTPQYCWYP